MPIYVESGVKTRQIHPIETYLEFYSGFKSLLQSAFLLQNGLTSGLGNWGSQNTVPDMCRVIFFTSHMFGVLQTSKKKHPNCFL